jgi:hypothetical protein
MVERSGHAESLYEVVYELGALDGLVDLAVAGEVEALVVVPA